MLALPCIAVAQEYFSSPGDKQSARPLPWQAAGLRAALADASPLLRSLAVQHVTWKHWGDGLLTAKDLEPLLQSPDEEIKKRAAKALEQLSAKPASGGETPAGKGHDPFQSEEATSKKRAPEKIAPERVKELLTQLHAPDFYDRDHAVKALGRAGTLATSEMSSALVPLLQDPSLRVVCSAALALRGMGREDAACREALLRLLKAYKPLPEETDFLESISSFSLDEIFYFVTAADLESSPEFISQIVRQLKDPVLFVHSEYTRSAVSSFVQAMGPKITPYLKDLLPLLQDANPNVQLHAMYALLHVGDEAAPIVARALLPLFTSTDDTVRRLTANYCYTLGPAAAPVVVPALLPFLKKTHDASRLRAIVSLGRLGPAAAPAARELLAVLDHPDTHPVGHLGDFSQHAAAEALGQLGPGVVPLVVPALVQHFKDGDAMLGFSILRAFETMGPVAAPLAIPAALPLLQSTDGQIKIWAFETLALWGNFKRDPAWQCAALAGATAATKDDDLQYLRYSLYLWSGHDDALLRSVRWLGRPSAAPMPVNGEALTAAEQQAVLGMLLKLWPHSASYQALRQEMAGRIRDVAQSITTAPEEKVGELLTKMDELLKTDAVKETQPASTKARAAVQSVLVRGKR
jgi:HEAT repeat protein